ncbi:LacI family DNA-binding transcriptional regulator [Salinibacterium sp. ZJ454]|uniref:LacI family DNA-binding transcriptional regulator n=1 Tax=Salinibacterium sp. ZJ454 TaxID=2708339 RepID=UPI001420F9AB|nr:LacI family DNA-binding transcriptional regulator [Salinibacterium sp. ZJ454]
MGHEEELPGVRPPTIYDVAAACNVSPSTVSRAFSRPGRVNAETADRIRRVAEQLGYHVDPIARPRGDGRTSMIALVVADLTNPFFLDIIQGAQKAADEAHVTVLVIDARESLTGEREAVERVIPMVDGLIFATSRMSETAIRTVAKQRATVILNRPMPDVPSIVTDNARGMQLAVGHLAALGHDTISYIAGPEASWADGMRWQSVRKAAADAGQKVRRIGPFPPTLAGGAAAANEFLARPSTGVIAYNDLMAIGLMSELGGRGIRVPDDVSVIGFDNSLDSRFTNHGLTTVAVPHLVLGRVAVQMLLGQHRAATVGKPAMLPAELMVRRSTAIRRDGGLRGTRGTRATVDAIAI